MDSELSTFTQGFVMVGTMLGFFLLLTGGLFFYSWRERKLQHEERRLMIEKGLVPPSEPGGWPGVKQRETELRFEERRLMIEKGMVPVDYDDEKRRRDGLRGGVLWFCLGLGLGITYFLLSETSGWRGFLAFASPALSMFGLAHIVNYWLGRERRGA